MFRPLNPHLYSEQIRQRINLPEGCEGLLEFASVKLAVAIEVHALEDHFESANSYATLLLDGKLELKVKFADHNILVDSVEGHRAMFIALKLII